MLKNYLEKLMRGKNLQRHESEELFNILLTENLNNEQVAALLVLLRSKPETVEEMVGIVNSLRKNMVGVPYTGKLIDIVGTGGDNARTVNISTGSAIIAAACGAKVAKHGNRAVSSLCGSADVLQQFGVNIELSAEGIINCIDKVGIGFCYSPLFHPSIGRLRILRKNLNVPTTFNLLGPLLNPAKATHYLLGVYDKSLMEILAELVFQLGTEHSLIIHGNGLDELSCLGPSEAIEVTRNGKKYTTIDPKDYGFSQCELSELQGGNAELNAHLLYGALLGEKTTPLSETLLLNAGISLWLYGLYPSIEEAIAAARNKLMNGEALALLKRWVDVSQQSVLKHE